MAEPVRHVLLDPIDDPSCHGLLALRGALKQAQEIGESMRVPLMRRATEQDESSVWCKTRTELIDELVLAERRVPFLRVVREMMALVDHNDVPARLRELLVVCRSNRPMNAGD